MKAYVFSIGETTTDLCVSQLKKMGFEVHILYEDSPLWAKLKKFYKYALEDGDDEYLRVDADIIPNDNVLKLIDINGTIQIGWKSSTISSTLKLR